MAVSVERRPTIDRAWLEAAARRDPIAHAYAIWDLVQAPDRVRFVSVVSGDATLGYLLVWLGHPPAPIVHWVGAERMGPELAEALPPRPFVAIVPAGLERHVAAARGPGTEYPLLALVRSLDAPAASPVVRPGVRRLRGPDRPLVAAWARRHEGPEIAGYGSFDPDREVAWGAFDHDAPVGAARITVRLPGVWVLSGVFVAPAARRAGWGRALVATAAAEARAAGAPLVAYVREDRTSARRLYESLGFRPFARRTWIDAGAGLEP